MKTRVGENKEELFGTTGKLLADLVGTEVTLVRTGSQRGIAYSARVLMVEDRVLTINLPRRIAGSGYLRTSARVTANFVIEKELFEADGQYKAEGEGIRELIITGAIAPATRRHFVRLPIEISTGFVPVSDMSLSSRRLPRTNWQWCMAGDLSGGGVLLQTRSPLVVGSYILISFEIESFGRQLFIFGQVRWAGLADTKSKNYHSGIRFITHEEMVYHFSPPALSWMPPIIQQFDKEMQDELDKFLQERSTELEGDQNEG